MKTTLIQFYELLSNGYKHNIVLAFGTVTLANLEKAYILSLEHKDFEIIKTPTSFYLVQNDQIIAKRKF